VTAGELPGPAAGYASMDQLTARGARPDADQRPLEPALPAETVRLQLDEPLPEGEEPVAHDVSAVAHVGDTLFLAADECAHVEVLDRADDGLWSNHRRVRLADLFDLPHKADEMDVEGLAADEDWLWIVGSHSRTRKKPKKHKPVDAAAVDRMAELKANPNRMFLGRLPLIRLADGRWGVGGVDGIDPRDRKPEMMSIGAHGSALYKALKHDPHLGPFTKIPAKENGLDVEGIAADGPRVAVGLRGPVINGWACVVEFRVRGGAGVLKLDGAVSKRWLDLEGLGIRDLKRDGRDLLILAGPSMALDGPAAVWRWRDWVGSPPEGEDARLKIDVEKVLELPYGRGCDHPEGIAPWDCVDGGPALLVVSDSPARARLSGGSVTADVFRL